MGAFKTPSVGVGSADSGVDKGERFLGPGGQSEAEFVSARNVSEEQSFDTMPFPSGCSNNSSAPLTSSTCEASRGPSSSGLARAERCMETAEATTSIPSSTYHSSCFHSGTRLSSEHGANENVDVVGGESGDGYAVGGGVGDSSETSLMIPQGPRMGFVEETGDHDIGAADWLDVAHAMLDED